jgi:menaquinone-dependent protoporphyrinogen oxidase
MKALIVTASRYGSTEQIGRWIAERFIYEGFDTDVKKAGEYFPLDVYEIVVMGSGIYSHKILPELASFIEQQGDELKEKKIAIFGVAMKTTPIFHKGKVQGGIEHLVPLIEKLNGAVIHADMLHGEMVYQKMTDKDKDGLLKFYRMLNLSDYEIEKRLLPRTLMDKKEVWEFAETVIKKLNGGQ